ncbi:hypothetical protein [Nesterenkonia rhizosphaerae]|uniref:Uncharacterized protein n=1 Tax=Nesterenkonia rhizosphaerae TaxID=1348272 RepID=A0ABP9FSW9_9MICC
MAINTYGAVEENDPRVATPAPVHSTYSEEDTAAQAGPSLLEELGREAQRDITRTIRYEVKDREGWEVEFTNNISTDDYKRYQNAGTKNGKKDASQADLAKIAGMPLVERNTGIYRRGQLVTDQKGDPITFRSEEFLEMFRVFTALDAVRKFLGDGYTISLANDLYKQAGFNEDAAIVDPKNA